MIGDIERGIKLTEEICNLTKYNSLKDLNAEVEKLTSRLKGIKSSNYKIEVERKLLKIVLAHNLKKGLVHL